MAKHKGSVVVSTEQITEFKLSTALDVRNIYLSKDGVIKS
jgi:hypothetical protein